MENKLKEKIPFVTAFSVGTVLFSAHAGGGFATGNQANTYYVSLGWLGPVSAVIAMLILTATMREAMIMYNTKGLTSHKDLFRELYHPFDKLYVAFEIFFNIMVLMAVAAAISGAASAMSGYFGLNYYIGIAVVGAIVLSLTIFGSSIVRSVSAYMGIAILVTAISIYTIGIIKGDSIGNIISADFASNGFKAVPMAIKNGFVYAGFQCVTLPTMAACGVPLKGRKGCTKAMRISFIMNAAALVLSILMLMSWQGVYTAAEGGTVLPTLTSCRAIGIGWMTVSYGICLVLCLISTGVTTTFGFVARFEGSKALKNVKSPVARRAVVAAFIIILSMTISLAGLTNIIKYGYGYCGYLGIGAVIIPFLTAGIYKNRKYVKDYEKDIEIEEEAI